MEVIYEQLKSPHSEMNSLCRQLNKGKVKPVALSLIEPYSDQFVLKSRQILTISGLFDPENMSLSYPDLLKKCFNLKITLSSEEISQIVKDTCSVSRSVKHPDLTKINAHNNRFHSTLDHVLF